MRGYQAIKELSRETGQPIPQLLALARQNDPYFAGSPANVELGEWFRGVWRKAGFSQGVHLRRVHYQLVSTGAGMHNFEPYQNTLKCWDYLCQAGKAARYLGYVSPTAFEDRRNPPPTNNVYARWAEPEPACEVYSPAWELPAIKVDIAEDVDLSVPEPSISGYDYQDVDQPYHLVLFVEKSTMNDVLAPLCARLGADYITSLGFQSITTVIGLLQRIEELGKPCRIAYISDFDPAGDFMPVGVARQLEYWAQDYCSQEIKLEPICLTKEQVLKWNLPTVPIKESDLRANGFMERRGCDGAVELDAMEALHPGELARIVRKWAEPYRDTGYSERLVEAQTEAESEVSSAWHNETEAEREDLDEIRRDAVAVIRSYEARLQALADEMAQELEPIQERIESVRQAVQAKIDDFSPELPERPEAITDGDNGEMLFDSNREYMEQLSVYKARKAGESLG